MAAPSLSRKLSSTHEIDPAMKETIRIEEVDPALEAALHCLGKYYADLHQRFPEGFEVGRSRDPSPTALRRPQGTFLVAYISGQPIGCVALKGVTSDSAEIKRLWVAENARGHGVARRLMAAAEAVAVELGFRILRLDTNRALEEARQMYSRWGWTEIERFNDDPYADYFFEKTLLF